MVNKIYINDVLVAEYIRGKSKRNPTNYQLTGGGFCTKDDLRDVKVEIQCNGDGSLYKIRSITSAHLNRPYFGFRWRGLNQNPFKGKRHSDELKKRLSSERRGSWYVGENNPMFGRTNYDVWLDKYGKVEADRLESERRRKFSISISGKNNPFFGKAHSQETIDALKESSSKWFGSLTDTDKNTHREKIRNSQHILRAKDPMEYRLSKARGGRASMLSQMPTWIPNNVETVVQSELIRRNVPFEFGVVLGGFQFDFGNKQNRILLEVHGDYWHANPIIYGNDKRPINDIQRRKVERDVIKSQFCLDNNFRLFTIWESDVKIRNFSVLDDIEKLILANPISSVSSLVK